MQVRQDDTGAAGAAAGAVGGALPGIHKQDAVFWQQMFDTVCDGQLSEARNLVQNHYGDTVLDSNPRLDSKVQQFVEVGLQASSSSSSVQNASTSSSSSSSSKSTSGAGAALIYGWLELGPGSMSLEGEELLSDALSLLAYADPAASPCGHLFRQQQVVMVAEELKCALLKVMLSDFGVIEDIDWTLLQRDQCH